MLFGLVLISSIILDVFFTLVYDFRVIFVIQVFGFIRSFRRAIIISILIIFFRRVILLFGLVLIISIILDVFFALVYDFRVIFIIQVFGFIWSFRRSIIISILTIFVSRAILIFNFVLIIFIILDVFFAFVDDLSAIFVIKVFGFVLNFSLTIIIIYLTIFVS